MKINLDNEEYQVDPEKLLVYHDHIMNGVLQQSMIEYKYNFLFKLEIPYF
jgi:hypothetical protein